MPEIKGKVGFLKRLFGKNFVGDRRAFYSSRFEKPEISAQMAKRVNVKKSLLKYNNVRVYGSFGNFAVSVVITYKQAFAIFYALCYYGKFAFISACVAPRSRVYNKSAAFYFKSAVLVFSRNLALLR